MNDDQVIYELNRVPSEPHSSASQRYGCLTSVIGSNSFVIVDLEAVEDSRDVVKDLPAGHTGAHTHMKRRRRRKNEG